MTQTNAVNATKCYLQAQIKSAAPVELVIIAYDLAIAACAQRDLERLARVLSVLRNALDFRHDHGTATRLFKTYLLCGKLARPGNFSEAAQLLGELREFWVGLKKQGENEITGDALLTRPEPLGRLLNLTV
ncbi:MAG: hypothetical protein HY717_20095 [Planctomycetes bacterium]|nr:hypothetical protein [Planctomycetota bacterium]